MSGILAVLDLDGCPIDRTVLEGMMRHLVFRGPDGCGTSCIGPIGLGHAHLRVDDRPHQLRQPVTLDNRSWIVADARIDRRAELAAELNQANEPSDEDADDAELILRAYHAWGGDCVEHLLGDFAFVIWDAVRQELLCARDHLGVKPLFYAQFGLSLVVSNTLDCIRRHPLASSALDEEAIAEFLLFGGIQDPAGTVYRDIRRVPPAHSATWSRGGGLRRCCYWTLPVEEPIQFRRADEYEQRFGELLRMSLRDRLRTRHVSVLMSGGLDSPTLAAVAAGLLRERGDSDAVHAITSVYDRLVPDAERHYAALVASYLGIPIEYDIRDDETSIVDWTTVHVQTPEPVDNPPAFLAGVQFFRRVAAHSRVLLYGEGPDDALRYEWRPYLRYLISARQFQQLLKSTFADLWIHKRVPFGSSMLSRATARRGQQQWRQDFPAWLNEDFAAATSCRARWEAHAPRGDSNHPVRPRAYADLRNPVWQRLFDDCDLMGAFSHTTLSHPFLDLRLLGYMLAVPAIPWCRHKALIRRSMRGRLPAPVLARRKTPAGLSPDLVRVRTSGLPNVRPTSEACRYINFERIPRVPATSGELRAVLRPLGLAYWLENRASTQGGHV